MYTEFDTRMKSYEEKIFLKEKTPVIIRIDGKAFHTYTRGISPFNEELSQAMAETAIHLCQNIQGSDCAYTQSDEISILLRDWDREETQMWFAGNLQKIVSISASLATAKFNSIYISRNGSSALFDSRAFNVPFYDVWNYFIWRQADCKRNSISTLARTFFSQKQLDGVSSEEKKQRLLLEKSIDWDKLPNWKKLGRIIKRAEEGFVIIDECPEFMEIRKTGVDYFDLKVVRYCALCSSEIYESMGSIIAETFVEFAKDGTGEVKELCPKCVTLWANI